MRVAVVGAAGYTGLELLECLAGHPQAKVVAVFGSGRGGETARTLSSEHPRLRGRLDLPIRTASVDAIAESGADAVFLATPHEVSASLAPPLTREGLRVLDLSGAFRLSDASAYPRHYGFAHGDASVLASAVYGMPELHRERLAGASLIALPGCYPTASILALWPLVNAGLVRAGSTPIVDAVSGVSGAGRAAKVSNLFCEVSLRAYGLPVHRHEPEIAEHAGTAVVFTPHVGPFDRGILATIHVELDAGVDAAAVDRAYEDAFAGQAFVRLLPKGEWPSVGAVVRTNFCDLAWLVDEASGRVRVFSAIDNLVKGASGQAVQAMNAAFGLDETLGLLPTPGSAQAVGGGA
ncbi:MAG: N-acetyl-gamma-glutamyl-phosphate reductase [Phycisphaerales bacterium]|nr:MAG: N-acetyl-gamma-glutamyl-phosphate reductase [Phycisphaerales bacterium]